MIRRILCSSLNFSRFRLKNAGFFANYATNGSETSTAPTDQINPIEKSVDSGASGDGVQKSSWVTSSSPVVIYEFFKRLVDNRRDVKSVAVLIKSMKGVIEGNFYNEFADYYFDFWMKEWRKLSDDETTKKIFDPQVVVSDLGKINIRSGGVLSTKLNVKDFQNFESAYILNERKSNTIKSSFLFFNGLGKLASTKPVFTQKLISDQLVSNSLDIFEKTTDENGVSIQNTEFFAGFLQSLPLLNIVLNKSDLDRVCKCFKKKFDDKKFADIGGGDNSLEYFRRVRALNQFADAFLAWNLNADECCDKIWIAWFAASKNLLMINSDLVYRPYHPRGASEGMVYQRTLGDETLHLCSTITSVALKFDKLDQLSEMNEFWSNVLRKNVAAAGNHPVIKFSNSLRRIQLYLSAKRFFDSKSAVKDFIVVDDVVAEMIAKKIEYYNRFSQKQVLSEQLPQRRVYHEDDFSERSSRRFT